MEANEKKCVELREDLNQNISLFISFYRHVSAPITYYSVFNGGGPMNGRLTKRLRNPDTKYVMPGTFEFINLTLEQVGYFCEGEKVATVNGHTGMRKWSAYKDFENDQFIGNTFQWGELY